MSADSVKNQDEELLEDFMKSFSRRYQQWKKADLLAVALETMPKQVEAGKVIDNLIKLRCEFSKRLNLAE